MTIQESILAAHRKPIRMKSWDTPMTLTVVDGYLLYNGEAIVLSVGALLANDWEVCPKDAP